jgi:hypothetical protein
MQFAIRLEGRVRIRRGVRAVLLATDSEKTEIAWLSLALLLKNHVLILMRSW